jgi:hypothetical protein
LHVNERQRVQKRHACIINARHVRRFIFDVTNNVDIVYCETRYDNRCDHVFDCVDCRLRKCVLRCHVVPRVSRCAMIDIVMNCATCQHTSRIYFQGMYCEHSTRYIRDNAIARLCCSIVDARSYIALRCCIVINATRTRNASHNALN